MSISNSVGRATAARRTSVVTGSASGIGKALQDLLVGRGERVIGVDVANADVVADLGTPTGRASMIEAVSSMCGGRLDAVYANAGTRAETPAAIAVNFFGAVATLNGLRPLLAGSAQSCAVVTGSIASFLDVDDELVDAALAGDEPRALARVEALASGHQTARLIYPSSKRALVVWLRQRAASEEWAGSSIALNAVAPGLVDTPMTAALRSSPETLTKTMSHLPMPLGGVATPMVVARLMAWLGSEENTHVCGQVVFVDGGTDVALRGALAW